MWPHAGGMRALELGTAGEMRAKLNCLVLAGDKTATAGLLADYAAEGEEVEHVGELMALVDDAGQRVATVRINEVVLRNFAQVPWDFAQDEGEGFTSIEHWREGHQAFWQRVGTPVKDDSVVVCLRLSVTDRG